MGRSIGSLSRAILLAGVALLVIVAGAESADSPSRWTRFGYDAQRSNHLSTSTGITAANVSRLARRRIVLDGTVDSSPILAGGFVVVTTSYGKAIALDAVTGRVRWRFTPPRYSSWAGTYRITNSSPVSDGRFVWTAAPDGRVYKIVLATGRQVTSGGWPATVTRLPTREKLGTALNLSRGRVIVTAGGFNGDQPPYQGHVVALDARSGRIEGVFNALCSERKALQAPGTCVESGAAIWARSGAVVEPATGNLLVATGDGKWDGRRHWGDSVLLLSPDARRLLQAWTPASQAELESGDVDLGSTAPVILPGRLVLQSGKDAIMRVLDLRHLNGRGGAGAVTGGEVQTLPTPGGTGLFTAPAVSRRLVFVADGNATAAYRLDGRRLQLIWRVDVAGTSPVVAGGLLYVYDPGGGLNVYVPETGRLLERLPAGPGHWSSPIVAAGRVYLPEGSANDHAASGVLNIYEPRVAPPTSE
jgi:outer membrane protein assembly factor BamB